MSKEVKLGLAIGGILLSVLIVYALVVSGDPSPTPEVTLAMPEQGQAAPEPAMVSTPPQNDPFQAESPVSQPPGQPAGQPVEQPPVEAPASQPAVAELDQPAVLGEDKWVVLHNGMPLQTETPQPQRDPVREPQPPAATRNPGPSVPVTSNPVSQPPEAITAIPAASAASSGPRTHVVQRGETYSSIAAAAYGNSAYYAHLIRANPGIDANKLRPGMVIKLPPESEVKVVNTARAETRTIDSATEYRVQSTDNLYKISMKLYGKPDRMDKIYEINKTTIGSDRSKLQPGMVLKLPETPTVASR